MDDRLSVLEHQVERLAHLIDSLDRRVAALESAATVSQAAAAGAVTPADAHPAPPVPALAGERVDLVAMLSLVGRLLIVLGGGYLLRAMTEAGTLVPAVGIAAGLLYALGWTAAAGRAAAAGRRWSATFHGLATALIGFPVIWEGTARFGVFGPSTSAMVLAAFVAVILGVACRRRHQPLAWTAAIAALAVSMALIASTHAVVPFALLLIGLGVATLWIGYSLDWLLIRWPVALVADLVVVGLTARALATEAPGSPGVAVSIQILLLGAYLASIAVRTLVRGRDVIPFEVAQTALALVVGLGGAIAVTRATGGGTPLLGWSAVLFGAACYSVAFAFIDRRQRRTTNVYFYTFLALVFVITGCSLVLGTTPRVLAWLSLAALASVAWARFSRLFLLVHGAAYLLAAGLVAGVIGYATATLTGPPPAPWVLPSGLMVLTLAVAAACSWMASWSPAQGDGSFVHAPRLVIVCLLLLTAGGTAIGHVTPLLGADAGRHVDPGALATIRTVVLSLSVLLVGWIGRHGRFAEWGWLVYPLLVVTGLKLISEDLRASRPATLFVAMAIYGVALIVAPRFKRAASPK